MTTKLDTTWLEDSFTHVATILHGAGIHSVEELENRVKLSVARAEPSRGAPDAVAKLRAARTAWHEKNGVPISQEYANFLTAIGEVEDGHVVLLEALRGYQNSHKLTSPHGCACLLCTEAEAAIQQAERT